MNIVFFLLPFICIKILTYEDNVKPWENVQNAKEMSTDYRSSLHGRGTG